MKKKENRQFSSFFLEWGCQAMNKALRCPAWSCAPRTSCTGAAWLAPASRDGTLGHRAARQTPSHSSKDRLLSCRRHTMAGGMASVQSQWSMSHESCPAPSRRPEDAGLTLPLYPFPLMKDESNNLWQFPPLPTPSQILPSPVGHKHIFNELGPPAVPQLSLPLAGLRRSMHAEGVVWSWNVRL